MKHILALIAAAALTWSFLPQRAPAPTVSPSPVTAAVSGASAKDRARVASFYSAVADVIERDAGAVKTVGQFSDLHARSLDLAFKGTDLPGKYPGLDSAINTRLVEAVGRDDVPLTPGKRQALVQALKDVANAAK